MGCGRCLPCRIKKRREWTHRCLLESYHHKVSSFVTMTYSPRRWPAGGSLDASHFRHFVNLLRRALAPARFRFYGCGEYGEESQQPHYHLSLFGVGIEHSGLIQRIWPLGYTAMYPLNETTAQYVAGYVTKKMTSPADPRLNGRSPEFGRMSNRPGIGALSLGPIVDAIHTDPGLDYLAKLQDVPDHVMIADKKVFLGRYLRQKLREEIGMPEEWQARAKQNGVNAAVLEAQTLQAVHSADGYVTQAQAIIKESHGRAEQMKAFSTIVPKKGSL